MQGAFLNACQKTNNGVTSENSLFVNTTKIFSANYLLYITRGAHQGVAFGGCSHHEIILKNPLATPKKILFKNY